MREFYVRMTVSGRPVPGGHVTQAAGLPELPLARPLLPKLQTIFLNFKIFYLKHNLA
jgi:hypothetical protein